MIPMARPVVDDAACEAVIAVLRSGMLAQGSVVQQFEERFAALCGVRYAIAASSGTTALHLALLAHGIGPGDEVITTSFSFIASANVALYTGATPVFADIDPATFQIDPDDVEAKITPRTRAVIPVHLYGTAADLGRLTEICQRHNLILIEDACQAHGATWSGRPVGSFGTGCFSFYPTKNVTSAEGGMVTTDDPEIAERARLLRAHGMPIRYHHDILGYNFRMTDVHAAIGLAQLDHLREWTDDRVCNAGTLRRLLEPLPVDPQAVYDEASHVYHQFTIRVHDGRDEVAAYLREQGVGCEVYYPIPIHQQQVYLERGYRDFLPHSERAAREVLSLPIHPSITGEELCTIASTLADALKYVSVASTRLVAD
jgi:dTDP-4-amino-4,6-dideoxygalactose transaminase